MSVTLKWFLFGWAGVTPPAPQIIVVGGRSRRLPYRPKHPRVEAVVRTLADDLIWEPPTPQFAEDEQFLELMLLDAL